MSDLSASLRLVHAADADPLIRALDALERTCEARLIELREAKQKRMRELKESP